MKKLCIHPVENLYHLGHGALLQKVLKDGSVHEISYCVYDKPEKLCSICTATFRTCWTNVVVKFLLLKSSGCAACGSHLLSLESCCAVGDKEVQTALV